MSLKEINDFKKELFLSSGTKDFLSKVLRDSGMKESEVDFYIESYADLLDNISSLYIHGTGSYALRSILSSGTFSTKTNSNLTGERATDPNAHRDFFSFYSADSIHNVLFATLFSFYSVSFSKLDSLLDFKSDKGFPKTLYEDIKNIQVNLYPELSQKRVRKMLKVDQNKDFSKEDTDKAYEKWLEISLKRESFQSRKIEELYLNTLNLLKESFSSGELPTVSFDGIESNNIKEIVNGLNIYTAHNIDDAKYHLLRAIYIKLIEDGVLTEDELENQESNVNSICEKVFNLLNTDHFSKKILDPKDEKELLIELENQFPVLILFDLDSKSEEIIYANNQKGTIDDIRSKEDLPIKGIKYVLVPYKNIAEAENIVKERGIKVFPLEIVEMLRSVLHKYM